METKKIPIFSWAEITCGEACWRGKEDNCICSCGGKNHGIWRNNTNSNVARTCKITGHFYKLKSVGKGEDIKKTQKELLASYGLYDCYEYDGKHYHQSYLKHFCCRGDKDSPGFPLVTKYATLSQCHKWIELSTWKDITKAERTYKGPVLLWERVETPNPIQCLCFSGLKREVKK